jgi:hypothetical protein
MDAADDCEIKLQRASGDLVKEFLEKLPSLLWKQQTSPQGARVPRRWTLASKTERLVNLVGLCIFLVVIGFKTPLTVRYSWNRFRSGRSCSIHTYNRCCPRLLMLFWHTCWFIETSMLAN